jgi:ferritin-like metal-binding protein YciE
MMAQTPRDFFVTGLRNAYAMEVEARELLERQIGRTGDYPELRSRLKLHLDETHVQIDRIEDLLKSMGESPSALKDMSLSLMANVSTMMHAMSSDEIIKNILANNMFENFEIGAYKSLIAMSHRAGVPSAETVLRSSLMEETNMARWVCEHIEPITLSFLAKAEQHDVQVAQSGR